MKTVPLADVLWTAANVHLNATGEWPQFSCHATTLAEIGRATNDKTAGLKFLYELGCSFICFDAPGWKWLAARSDETVQGVRYMWLLLAMHVAEDENIMVEIAK